MMSADDRKHANMVLNDREYAECATVLKSAPYIYSLGVTNICQLKCPLCITGLRKQNKKLQHMPFHLFQSILEKIKEYAVLIQLFRWGEPLLYPHFIDMLEYCYGYNLNTEVSSNLSFGNIDEKLEAMARFELKTLTVAMDGVTQKTYEKYRVGGNLGHVLNNIQKIVEFREKHGTKYPEIVLQFLLNKHSSEEVEMVRRFYKKWGFDRYVTYNMSTVFKDRNPLTARKWFTDREIQNRKYMDIDYPLMGRTCKSLYNSMIIEQDGSITPCCFCTDPRDDFGIWNDDMNIQEMYNEEKYIQARDMFKVGKSRNDIVCDDCSVFMSCINPR